MNLMSLASIPIFDIAALHSDTEAAQQMQRAKRQLFDNSGRPP